MRQPIRRRPSRRWAKAMLSQATRTAPKPHYLTPRPLIKKSRARVTCVYAAGFSSSSAEAMPAEYEKDPNFLLTVHGYVMGMRRVKGDDGDKDQILRYIIADKEKVTWGCLSCHRARQDGRLGLAPVRRGRDRGGRVGADGPDGLQGLLR